MLKIYTVTLILLITLMQSCGDKSTTKSGGTNKPTTQTLASPSAIKLESPLNGSTFTTNDSLKIRYKTLSDTLIIDSAIININGKHEAVFNSQFYTQALAKSKMGMQRVSLTAYSKGKQAGTLTFVYTVKPQAPPKTYTYNVVKEYPHLSDAFTQGLFFHNGFLYEGTGEYGQSSLRKVELATGKVLQNIKLDSKYFGEGICIYDNRIYQLTWQNRVGFIYNAETFEKISEFNYPTEGWGITTDGTYLIMSDGSANLYFIDPKSMAIVKQIEAYSYAGAVDMLNELEYINGEIWANIYHDDSIAIIDAETGEVKGLIDLKGILKKADRTRDTEVLNGIAYEPDNKRIFVTGKNWSKLFEIKIAEK